MRVVLCVAFALTICGAIIGIACMLWGLGFFGSRVNILEAIAGLLCLGSCSYTTHGVWKLLREMARP